MKMSKRVSDRWEDEVSGDGFVLVAPEPPETDGSAAGRAHKAHELKLRPEAREDSGTE